MTKTESPSPFSAGRRVRCTKISEKHIGVLPTAYWLEGRLYSDLVLGRPIKVVRSRRAGREENEPSIVECEGMFVTTEIDSFERNEECPSSVIVDTVNSCWRVDLL
jgi:hypothetical protein